MTIGIYALFWPEQGITYIGQSVRIEKRFQDHNYRASIQKDSSNLNDCYKHYGQPNLIILEECLLEELDDKEIFWISQFDCINKSVGGKNGGWGYNSAKCTSTKDELINALELLTDESLTIKNVSSITEISENILQSIIYGKRHSWLAEECPEQYKKATSINRCSIAQQKRFNTNVTLISPEGIEYTINNLSSFCKKHGLNKGHICAVARGSEKQYKKWKRKEVSGV